MLNSPIDSQSGTRQKGLPFQRHGRRRFSPRPPVMKGQQTTTEPLAILRCRCNIGFGGNCLGRHWRPHGSLQHADSFHFPHSRLRKSSHHCRRPSQSMGWSIGSSHLVLRVVSLHAFTGSRNTKRLLVHVWVRGASHNTARLHHFSPELFFQAETNAAAGHYEQRNAWPACFTLNLLQKWEWNLELLPVVLGSIRRSRSVAGKVPRRTDGRLLGRD